MILSEQSRLKDLNEYQILDTPPEIAYDAITRLASAICDTPISLVTLIDQNRQWLKSKIGVDIDEIPREIAFCNYTIQEPSHPLIVEDSVLDVRFSNSPFVTGDPHVRFYAGVPLVSPRGQAIGTLCVFDQRPKQLSQFQVEALQDLAAQVVWLFELRRSSLENIKARNELAELNKSLQLAKSQAELAREDKARFLSTMSHEIRNSLNPIIGACDLLLMEDLNEESKELVDILQFSSQTLHTLLDDILAYSKLEAGKVVLEKIPFDLKKVVHRVIDAYQPSARGKAIELNLKVDGSIPQTIYGDPGRLVQVLNNLISNAIKFTEKGQVSLRVFATQITEKWVTTQFEVADTGIGMPPEFLDHLFEEFTQATPETSRLYQGSGLGLSIVRLILLQYKSQIQVESSPGKGTCFRFAIDFLLY
ncbi:GAF domain-containing sensor histidine kinase [Siphonobacter sp. SORGH_AS_0500]|uniref:GAF domain-containing sensor histidine kinase n=1 Tax=Siphonobacter sp. SORGH_AS_0500 TaxID=1864824 RepID=UPI000CC98432|nr:ATP-binding protein [Siphonobacter sp. SORGH_AS_0500]MDR6195256.1 signal transduction histidine kinase [Siphonobacter sp. SORGH_AS_0500]PKK38287.1 hypothetical protein BWI96_00385 [Siphonobacter sp. SORGH_AS_0500]